MILDNVTISEMINRLAAAVEEENEEVIGKCIHECSEEVLKMCLPDKDELYGSILKIFSSKLTSSTINSFYLDLLNKVRDIMPCVRFFYALFPPNKSIEAYKKNFYELADRSDTNSCVVFTNSLIAEYGICCVPDIILLIRVRPNVKLYNIINHSLRSAWSMSTGELKCESMDNDVFFELGMSYMKQAFEPLGFNPKFLDNTVDLNLESMVTNDITALAESYSGEELENKLEQYTERYLDAAGAYHIMANLMQEGNYSIACYPYIADMFESIGDRCEREDKYLALCEAQYRSTGKLPKYLSDTYNISDDEPKEEKKSSDDWINAPSDDIPDKVEKSTKKTTDKVNDDIDDIVNDIDKSRAKEADVTVKIPPTAGGNVYNITYNNSFNKSRKNHIRDSYNQTDSHSRMDSHNRTYTTTRVDSDNISGSSMDAIKDRKSSKWEERKTEQKKIVTDYKDKAALSASPADVTEAYLNNIKWAEKNSKDAADWVILRDVQDGRPKEDVQYRKYLAKKIKSAADDADIDYDGKIIVAGNPVEGIYDIEITDENDKETIDALRKTANAVVDSELVKKNVPKKTGIESVDAVNELMHNITVFEEEIQGGDPSKDRPIGQRIRNSIEDFNAKSEKQAAAVDRGLRTTAEIGNSLVRTPMQLLKTAKNFIADLSSRREQNLKEDLIKDRKLRMGLYDLTKSLLKTALPWVVLGPVFGTLWNFVALPIRGVKGLVVAARGGPHRDLIIEVRDEMKTELDIMDDRIRQAEQKPDRKQKYELMRMRQRMEREYIQIASKVKFDPTANKIANSQSISSRNNGNSW